jgi:hypothetical protein
MIKEKTTDLYIKRPILNKKEVDGKTMPTEEYLSLTFIAMASLGALFITPFFIESVLIVTVVLITTWKKIYESILTRLHIQDYVTTLIIVSIIFLGIIYLFKGSILFCLLGIIYLISSIYGFKNHLELTYSRLG